MGTTGQGALGRRLQEERSQLRPEDEESQPWGDGGRSTWGKGPAGAELPVRGGKEASVAGAGWARGVLGGRGQIVPGCGSGKGLGLHSPCGGEPSEGLSGRSGGRDGKEGDGWQ